MRKGFHDKLKLFVWEKPVFGAQGLEVTEEMRLTIAACAVRMILFLDYSHYDPLKEIVVYPAAYAHPKDGAVFLGEAHQFGTVVLSWAAVEAGLRNECDGHETAAHEFAHVLDQGNQAFDGTPRLRAREDYRPWALVMSRHFLALRDGAPRQRAVLRTYGGKNESEFFAVATEAFFEKPRQMRELLPDLYAELRRFYGFDPASSHPC